jgi:cell division protease FtsH
MGEICDCLRRLYSCSVLWINLNGWPSVLLDQLHSFLANWGIYIFFALLVLFTWFLVRSLPSTKPRTISARDDSKVRWDDVAGLEEARAELQEIVEFLQDPAKFEKLGARVPKGVLLHGPPGTGKTLLAKAVACESGANFYFQSASAFVEMWSGLGAARIRRLFETARENQPAIIFIDELDAVGAKRTSGGHNREHDQTLNQLLVELDGFDEDAQLVVVAASNRLDDLDPALLRPGRFDRHVLIDPPDLVGRERILQVHTRNKPLHPDVVLADLARQTAGLNGADLANICNEAAISAGRASRDSILTADFLAAQERVIAGLQQRKLITDKEKRVIAYHEAGHALVAHLTSADIHKVTILPRGRALGMMMRLPEEDRHMASQDELEDWLKVSLGGRAAEQVVFGGITNGAASDLDHATAIARTMVFDWGMGQTSQSHQMRADDYALSEETKRTRDREQRAITDTAYRWSLRLVAAHREHLDRLAHALLESETLTRAQVDELLADLPPVSDAARQIGVELEPGQKVEPLRDLTPALHWQPRR